MRSFTKRVDLKKNLDFGNSLIKIKNRKGPKIDPWDTPWDTRRSVEFVELMETCIMRLFR